MLGNYWNGTGRWQALADKLNHLVPPQGEVKGDGSEKLELFRRASNAYYDLFNNGGCNVPKEISAFFRVFHNDEAVGNAFDMAIYFQKTEPVMDKIILAAAAEQGIEMEIV